MHLWRVEARDRPRAAPVLVDLEERRVAVHREEVIGAAGAGAVGVEGARAGVGAVGHPYLPLEIAARDGEEDAASGSRDGVRTGVQASALAGTATERGRPRRRAVRPPEPFGAVREDEARRSA